MTPRPSRRRFVRASISMGGFALIGCKTLSDQASSQLRDVNTATLPVQTTYPPLPAKLRRRKNLSSAAGAKDLATFRTVVGLMKQSGQWETWAKIHNDFCPHNNWFFLPWHRWFLFYFEENCREILRQNKLSDDFSLPYWNWPDNNGAIPDAFWGDGNPLNDATRYVTKGYMLPMETNSAEVVQNILAIDDFLIFGSGRSSSPRDFGTTGQLEGTPHNTVHAQLGGDMSTFMSPLDPIFWVHHSNVDRLWSEWAAKHPGSILPPTPKPRVAQVTEAIFVDPSEQLTTEFWQKYSFNGYRDPRGSTVSGTPENALYTEKMPAPYTYDSVSNKGLLLTDSEAPVPKSKIQTIHIESINKQAVRTVDSQNLILSANISYPAELKPYVKKLLAGNTDRGQLVLTINHVPVPTDHIKHTIMLRFFANHPQINKTSSYSDPHFLTTLAFFSHGQHGDHGAAESLDFTIDLTNILPRLAKAGIDVSDHLTLGVVVVDRNLTSLPDLDFFKKISLRLDYTETEVGQ